MPIYFDNAATTPLAPEVLAAMLPYMKQHFGNPSSIHAMGRIARSAVEKARKKVAKAINASLGEIFFTGGGTESSNSILRGAVCDLGVRHIISSPIEHHCVLHTIAHLSKAYKVKNHMLALRANGHIDLNSLENCLKACTEKNDGKVLVSLMHVNNEIGNLLALEQVADLCKQYGAYFHSDTVQSIGYYALDMQALNIDFITGSAHKFHGPKGVGFMYINNEHSIQPFLRGGSQERNMRAGTENVLGIVGLGTAIDIAYKNLAADRQHISNLQRYCMQQLQINIPNIQFNGDCTGQAHYKIVNAAFSSTATTNTDLLLLNLDIAGICASGGSACSSGVDVGSHVLNALKVNPNYTNIRFSFSKYNTLSEIDTLISKLQAILKLH